MHRAANDSATLRPAVTLPTYEGAEEFLRQSFDGRRSTSQTVSRKN